MFVNGIKAERASFPIPLSFVTEILKDARPTVNMATFRYSWRNHIWEIFQTYWTLNILRIDHVINNLSDIFPINYFIGVKNVKVVIFSLLNNEFKTTLHILLFRKLSVNKLTSFLSLIKSSFSVRIVVWRFWHVFILLVIESKQIVCWLILLYFEIIKFFIGFLVSVTFQTFG